MKRIKIFKAYFVLWLFVYFIIVSNLETFTEYFYSTLTFNVAIVSILAIGTFMLLKGSKELTMITGTFGVLMYKKRGVYEYIQGIEKHFPSNISTKIKTRVKKGVLLFTEHEKEEILAWIDEKFSNQNKYNNFFIGTVLMIGLLGTFSGLLGSIGSMAGIVASLAGGDVDIGNIMAQFSQPLGSMAVGFGSSLFGVIAAILLSIKGYLLNKAQATLLEGVENWLNERTLESESQATKTPALISQNDTLPQHQQSFMDVFVEQISSLTDQMHQVKTSNESFKEAFVTQMKDIKRSYVDHLKQIQESNSEFRETVVNTIDQLQINHQEQNELLKSMHKSMDQVALGFDTNNQTLTDAYQTLSKGLEESNSTLEALTQQQLYSIKNSTTLSENVAKLSENTLSATTLLSQTEKRFETMTHRQEERDKDHQVEFFQLLETMETLDKNMKDNISQIANINKYTEKRYEEHKQPTSFKDYLQHHFLSSKKEEDVK